MCRAGLPAEYKSPLEGPGRSRVRVNRRGTSQPKVVATARRECGAEYAFKGQIPQPKRAQGHSPRRCSNENSGSPKKRADQREHGAAAAPWTPAPYRLRSLDQAPSLDRVGPPRRQSQGGARALWCSSGAAVRVILNALDAAALGKVLGRTDVARGRNGLHGVESRSHCALGPSVAQESEWMPGRLNVAGSVAAPCVDNRIMYNRGSCRCIAPRRGGAT